MYFFPPILYHTPTLKVIVSEGVPAAAVAAVVTAVRYPQLAFILGHTKRTFSLSALESFLLVAIVCPSKYKKRWEKPFWPESICSS